MLENLNHHPIPALFVITQQYKQDPRPNKMDLGLGVYVNKQGITPILNVVKTAEQRIVDQQQTKTYQPLTGHPEFRQSFAKVILGNSVPTSHIATCLTAGGTGALRILFELVQKSNPNATVWIPNLTWANHETICDDVNVQVKSYRYYHRPTGSLDFDGMMADIKSAQPNDVILLHGCCHNPTGVDLSPEQWHTLTEFVLNKNLLPIVDIAYQGFGDGLDQDAYGLRHMASKVPELMIGGSGSKNFGLYRDRVGLAIVVSTPDKHEKINSNMALISRNIWSMAPDHGAEVINTILSDPHLTQQWHQELTDMRHHIKELRHQLAQTFKTRTNSDNFDFISRQNGMFITLPITPEQTETLQSEYAIYMLPSGRISIASMKPEQMGYFVESFVAVTQ